MRLFLLQLVTILVGVVAAEEEKKYEFEPGHLIPPQRNFEQQRLGLDFPGQSIAGLDLFERQAGGECFTSTGTQFACAPNKCCSGRTIAGCCYQDQNCMVLNGNHACCPSDWQTCGNTMCTYANSTCCGSSKPGQACGPEQICCGSRCCTAGRPCCGDEGCCDFGQSCCTGSGSTKCCDNSSSQCCGGVCCPLNQDCCGDVCCDVGSTCETRGKCVAKTTAVSTVERTTTTTVLSATGRQTDGAAREGGVGVGVLGGLMLAAGLL